MSDLIQALTILLKYGNPKHPTHCEHDVLMICGIDPAAVSNDDIQHLKFLGFIISKQFGEEAFISHRFGSA